MSRLIHLLLGFFLFTIGIVYSTQVMLSQPNQLREEATLIFPRGTGFEVMTEQLAAAEVIRHPKVFLGYAVVTGNYRRAKAGEYAFPPEINAMQVLEMLVAGKVVEHKLTIPEGLTTTEVAALLAGEKALTGDAPARIPEGSLLPETYFYVYGDARDALIGRMQEEMKKVVAAAWEKRAEGLPLATPEEAVTLASIVEKETSLPAERKRVAAVYINRLRKNMRLQADPTVIYGMRLNGATEPIDITRADLARDSVYNTYVKTGLPPTPIANPGKAAIEAVLHPLTTDELFFVADGAGGHRFARTDKEHAANVRAYLASRKAPIKAAE